MAQRLKRLPAMQETWVQSLGQEDPLEKEMATHSSILAWRISRMEEPGRGAQEPSMFPPLPGKAIKLFFCTSPKTLAQDLIWHCYTEVKLLVSLLVWMILKVPFF